MTKNFIFKKTLFLLFVLLQSGCSTCHNKLIDSTTNEQWKADLTYRKCGTASGFVVDVYNENEGPHSTGEGSLESFKTIYKKHKHEPPLPTPITLKWISKDQLLIKHITKNNTNDESTDLTITKAANSYKDIFINYNPKPIIWE